MRTARVSLSVAVSAVLVTGLVALRPQAGSAQGNPFVGTWVLNVAKSTYMPGPPPKDQTSIYEVAGEGIKIAAKGTDAAGKPTLTVYTANYDGKDYPVTGNPDYDAISLKRVDAATTEFTRKRAGKVVHTGTNVVSKDGKVRTLSVTGVNAQGQKINNSQVYDKK